MATTFAILSIDANGVAVFQNGTGNADPLNVWLERGTPGVLVQGSWGEADANAQGWTYVGAETGDVPFAQRLNATSPVKGPAVPAPTPPPPAAPVNTSAPTISGTVAAGDTLTSAAGNWTSSTTPEFTYQWNRGTAAIQGADGSSYTVQAADEGSTLTVTVTATNAGGSESAASTPTIAVPTPVTPPPPPVITASYGMPSDIFNRKIAANPAIDPNNGPWMALVSASKNTSGSALATQLASGGWPIYVASLTDPVITIKGGYQNATCRLPEGAVPQGDQDGHMIIVEPPGVNPNPKFAGMTVETEIWECTVSGTWPNQTVTPGGGASPCQFNVSTTNGNFVQNIASSSPGSARGCGISCVAGLVLQAEFEAGVIPHAMAATAPFTAHAPYVAPSANTGAAGQPRLPAIISDGNTSGGIPESAHLQLDPAYDISGLSSSLQIIAKCHQDYGFFLTDSTTTSTAFQGQAVTHTNAAYTALGNGGSLAGLPWARYRVLAAGQ